MWLANKGQRRRLQQAPIRLEHGDRQGGGPEHPERGLQRWGESKYSEYSWEVIKVSYSQDSSPLLPFLAQNTEQACIYPSKSNKKNFTLTV